MVIISPQVSEVEALKKLLASAAQQLVPGGVLVLSGVDEVGFSVFASLRCIIGIFRLDMFDFRRSYCRLLLRVWPL